MGDTNLESETQSADHEHDSIGSTGAAGTGGGDALPEAAGNPSTNSGTAGAGSGADARVLICTSIHSAKQYALTIIERVLPLAAGHDVVLVDDDGCLPAGYSIPGVNLQVVTLRAEPDEPWWGHVGSRCARVRQAALDIFLNGNWTHIYWHDADTEPPAGMIDSLLAQGGVVAGVCSIRGLERVSIPMRAPGKAEFLPRMASIVELIQCPSSGLYEVGTYGMGCMLVPREAAAAVRFNPPAAYLPDLSEDAEWCSDYRTAGGHIWLDLSLSCKHYHSAEEATLVHVGEPELTCVWTGTPHFVRTSHSQWAAGEPVYGLSEAEAASLGPEFVTGIAPKLTLEITA